MSGTALLERPEETMTVSTRRACELADVTYRQLDYWLRCGYVTPTIPAEGSGSRRAFSASDVRGIAAVGVLAEQNGNDLRGAQALFDFCQGSRAEAAAVHGARVDSLTTTRITHSVIHREPLVVVPLIPLDEIEDALAIPAPVEESRPPRGGRLTFDW